MAVAILRYGKTSRERIEGGKERRFSSSFAPTALMPAMYIAETLSKSEVFPFMVFKVCFQGLSISKTVLIIIIIIILPFAFSIVLS